MKLWNRSPALFAGLVQSLLALAIAFGVNLTPEQVGAILAVTSAALALLTQQKVTRNGRGS